MDAFWVVPNINICFRQQASYNNAYSHHCLCVYGWKVDRARQHCDGRLGPSRATSVNWRYWAPNPHTQGWIRIREIKHNDTRTADELFLLSRNPPNDLLSNTEASAVPKSCLKEAKVSQWLSGESDSVTLPRELVVAWGLDLMYVEAST